MSIKENDFDFESMKAQALAQLRSGESLYGKNGAFAALMKKFLEAALGAEMESHMDEAERSSGNRRNGKTNKQIRTSEGTIDIDTGSALLLCSRFSQLSWYLLVEQFNDAILGDSLNGGNHSDV